MLGTIEQVVDTKIFRALADPTRIQVLSALLQAGGSARVGEVAQQLDIDQSGVSRHLQELERAGVISTRRQGRERICTLDVDRLISSFTALTDQLRRVKRGLKCC